MQEWLGEGQQRCQPKQQNLDPLQHYQHDLLSARTPTTSEAGGVDKSTGFGLLLDANH